MARKPTPFEKDELLRWFLYHMSMDQRHELMGTYPQTYKLLFPNVSSETINHRVNHRMQHIEEKQKNARPSNDPVL